jgi:prepilin-type N-terminal cleavage/methylation domain-containing protein
MKWNFPSRAAFTLLEIMVAITLLGMILFAIYASWMGIIKAKTVTETVTAQSQRTRITMHTLQDALVCACMFNANPQYYTFVAGGTEEFSSLSFTARLPKSFPRSGKFGDLDVRRLSFTIESSRDSGRQLVLRQSPILTDIDKDEDNFPLVLAKNVKEFKVEFTDPKSGDWISDWPATNQLPRKVRVQLALGNADSFSSQPSDVLVGTVAIAAQAVRVEWQLPLNSQAGARPTNGPNPGLKGGQNPGVNPGFNPPGASGGAFQGGQLPR